MTGKSYSGGTQSMFWIYPKTTISPLFLNYWKGDISLKSRSTEETSQNESVLSSQSLWALQDLQWQGGNLIVVNGRGGEGVLLFPEYQLAPFLPRQQVCVSVLVFLVEQPALGPLNSILREGETRISSQSETKARSHQIPEKRILGEA